MTKKKTDQTVENELLRNFLCVKTLTESRWHWLETDSCNGFQGFRDPLLYTALTKFK